MKSVSDPALNASSTRISPDGKYAITSLSNVSTPYQIWIYEVDRPSNSKKLEDLAGPEFMAKHPSLPQIITMETHDGLVLPAKVIYPKDFDASKKYPVHFDIYGGPDTPEVSDVFDMFDRYKWFSDNGIIEVIADCRASGHNDSTKYTGSWTSWRFGISWSGQGISRACHTSFQTRLA